MQNDDYLKYLTIFIYIYKYWNNIYGWLIFFFNPFCFQIVRLLNNVVLCLYNICFIINLLFLTKYEENLSKKNYNNNLIQWLSNFLIRIFVSQFPWWYPYICIYSLIHLKRHFQTCHKRMCLSLNNISV